MNGKMKQSFSTFHKVETKRGEKKKKDKKETKETSLLYTGVWAFCFVFGTSSSTVHFSWHHIHPSPFHKKTNEYHFCFLLVLVLLIFTLTLDVWRSRHRSKLELIIVRAVLHRL